LQIILIVIKGSSGSGNTLPDVLENAPQFLLDNPIALQRKYLKLKDDIKTKNRRAEMRKTVKAGEECWWISSSTGWTVLSDSRQGKRFLPVKSPRIL